MKVMYKKGISEDQIAVLTPYTSQKEVILNVLRNGFSKITVQTVTESQGAYIHCIYKQYVSYHDTKFLWCQTFIKVPIGFIASMCTGSKT